MNRNVVWGAPKVESEDEVRERMEREQASHMAQELNAKELHLKDRKHAIREQLRSMQLTPKEFLTQIQKLQGIAVEEQELAVARKEVHRMRTRRRVNLMQEAGRKKRTRDNREKKKILRRMKK